MADAPAYAADPKHWTDATVNAQLRLIYKTLEVDPTGQKLIRRAQLIDNPRNRYRFLMESLKAAKEASQERFRWKDNKLPVGVREFICSPHYMNKKAVVWPRVLDEIEEACNGTYVEAVFTGGIGCAKSTAALYIQAYMLYLLSRMKSPHAEFGLDPASEIMIIFQSLNATTAHTVEYMRFREMIEAAPYFQKHFRHDYSRQKMMHFPHRIIVKSVSGSDKAAIGQNVISGIIDEVNFMAVIEKSKSAADGGVYNQAIELYNSIVRRRESRFMKQGKVWGLLCLVSSARYPGQFTDKRKEAAQRQIKEYGRSNIYIYDKRAWEVMDTDSPTYSYSGEWFNLFLGDATRKPRILMDDESVPPTDMHLVMPVPIEHKHAFQDDIYDAIRDIGGMATLAAHPFIPYPEKVAEMFGRTLSIFSRDDIDFVETRTMIYPKRFQNPTASRYVHCDLALSGDSCGFVVGHVKGFTTVERSEGQIEVLPEIVIDGLLEIRPPRGGEIDLAKVRGVIYKLRDLGLPVKWVSYDSFNSADSIQIMKQKGFQAGLLSMDVTPIPYEITKQAIIDGRIAAPQHDKCQMELVTLERDPQTGKIDHTEVSSKDVADSLAGVVYGLTMRREIWALHGVNPEQIPRTVVDAFKGGKRAVEGGMDAKG